jgi:glycosyltransferase involved in cell wall biosynthesis
MLDVSIVICTRGRAELLDRLLVTLGRQITRLRFEIIVVDNLPEREVTEPPAGVRWIPEGRAGLSYARNTGIRAATAPMVAFLDDDMEVPETWLEDLTRPIVQGANDVVTGTTVGGHGHTGERKTYDREWLARHLFLLPLWEIGGLGNAAMRRDVFDRAGYFDEALGAGTPAGSWEDLELIYRMLASGCKILQEPAAAVLHVHRASVSALTNQLCAYRRGEVCFCVLAATRHRDLRGLSHLLLWIPYWRTGLLIQEVMRRILGKRLFRFDVMWSELLAYASGAAALASTIRRQRAIERQLGNKRVFGKS